jgi:surfactin synthase thioesterase subunit
MLPHRRYPMAMVKQDLGTQENLFETAFNYTHFYLLKKLKELPEFDLLDVRANSETEFVLRAEFSRHFFTDNINLSLHYHEHVFSGPEIERIGAAYLRIFALMTTQAGQDHHGEAILEADDTAFVMAYAKSKTRLQFGADGAGTQRSAGKRVAPSTREQLQVAEVWSKVLGIPLEDIALDDNFFDLGGHSLAVMRAVALLDRKISLANFMRNATLRPLASLLASTNEASPANILERLTPQQSGTELSVICFPYAGGNAINYHPLAQALTNSNLPIAVFAVEPPGHDSSKSGETLLDVLSLAKLVADQIASTLKTRIVLWGHCIGSSFAIETARILEQRGIAIEHLFIGGKLLHERSGLLDSIAQIKQLADQEIIDFLVGGTGYVEFDLLDASQTAALVGAFRHDALRANEYLLAIRDQEFPVALATPITVVAASDDPLTVGAEQHYGNWDLLNPTVNFLQIDGGGHYFCRTRPAEVAQIVQSAWQQINSVGLERQANA